MISANQYFTNPSTGRLKPHSAEDEEQADDLLTRVNALVDEAVMLGEVERANDPDTKTEISGARGGAGDGGFREQGSTTGNVGSGHRRGRAVDAYDPQDKLDLWLDSFDDGEGGNSKLEQYGLAREHPDHTPGWCHLQNYLPPSGRRTYLP